MQKRKLYLLLACLLVLCIFPAVTSALKIDAVNTLRETLLNCDTVITGKVQSVTIHEEDKSDDSVTNEYYAAITLKVQKTHFGETKKTISVKYPIEYYESSNPKELSVKKNNTLLLFLLRGERDETYSSVMAYKIASGRIWTLPSYYSEYDSSKSSAFIKYIKGIKSEIDAIRVNGELPTKEQLYDIHKLDNLLTYAGEGSSVVLAKIVSTDEKYNSKVTVMGASTNLQINVNKAFMGSLSGKIPALGTSDMGFLPGKQFICFINGNGNNGIVNSWIDIMEYKNGKIIMPENYSKREMSVDEFITLLEACPKYKSN